VPAFDDLPVFPAIGLLPVYMQNHMVVIVHDVQDVLMQRVHGCTGAAHRIGADIDGENFAERKNALPDPLPPVFVTLTGMGILTAEKGATHAAGDTVVVGGGFE
jgi:hypothetical protein